MTFSFMTFSTPALDLPAVLATAKRYGYEAVEPRLDAKHGHGIEVACSTAERAAIRKTVKRSGVTLSCLATSCVFANPVTRDAMVRDALARVALAADVGAPTLRVFGGAFPETLSREDAIAGVAEALKRIADAAAQRQVTVCLETHDSWCDPAHVAEVMRRVNHPAIAVNWDILHPVRMGLATIAQSFATLSPWIRHLHVHDWANNSFAPIGTGIVDHRTAIALLAQAGYTGAVSGEWINWEPYETHLPREIAVLRKYLAESAAPAHAK